MQSTPVGAPTTNTDTSSLLSTVTGSSDLGEDAFMKLLVLQMKNQDPTQPMDDTQFLSQLAQFSSLEQAQQTNTSLTALAQLTATGQAVSLVGKNVDYVDARGNTQTGQVSAITFTSKGTMLTVGDQQVNPTDVTKVW